MNREAYEALISRALDGDLDNEERRHLEMAMEKDPELRELAHDLEQLKRLASEPAPPCPASVEMLLQQRVREAYRSGKRRSFRFTPQIAMAAAVLVALALGFYFARPLFPGTGGQGPGKDPSSQDAYQEKIQAVHLAQATYHKAIKDMEDLALKRLEELPPEIAHDFARNLRTINQAIVDCERLSDEHPEAHMAYASLSRAYRAKVDLLETILET